MNPGFDRSALKYRARQVLSKNYLYLLSLTLIMGFAGMWYVGAVYGLGEQGITYIDITILTIPVHRFTAALIADGTASRFFELLGLLALLFRIFIGNVLTYGVNNAYRLAGEGQADADVFIGFRKDYLNVVKVLLLKEVMILLGLILLIVPGIMRMYDYYFVDYLLGEDPARPAREILAQSKEMAAGRRGQMFLLDLSFLPWIIAVVLLEGYTFGLAQPLVWPYISETQAQLYLELKLRLGIGQITGEASDGKAGM